MGGQHRQQVEGARADRHGTARAQQQAPAGQQFEVEEDDCSGDGGAGFHTEPLVKSGFIGIVGRNRRGR